MTLHSFIAAFVAIPLLVDASLAATAAAELLVPQTTNPPLRSLTEPHQVLIGAACRATTATLANPRYKVTLGREFDLVATEDGLKMAHIHLAPGQWDFSVGDTIAGFASGNGQALHGNVLVYHGSIPVWMETQSWTREALLQALETHVRTVANHYVGRMKIWDVVNEVWDNEGEYKPRLFYEVIGEDYAKLPFYWAHDADPEATLILNGNQHVFPGPAQERAFETVSAWLLEGVPIDGIGLQMHIKLDTAEQWGFDVAAARLAQTIDRFASLGLSIHVTELDVPIDLPVTPAKLARQAELYGLVMQVCLDREACEEITIWGFTDAFTWVSTNPFFVGYTQPLLYDAEYEPKPSYFAVQQALQTPPRKIWNEQAALGPPNSQGHALTFDASRGVAVLFGGNDLNAQHDETWEWNGASWLLRSPSTTPPARSGHAMAFDSQRNRILLFGGQNSAAVNLDDTWEWDGVDWTMRNPAQRPPGRFHHAMAYDAHRDRVVMFGSLQPTNDTWEWDGTNWIAASPTILPPGDLPTMAYYPPSQKVVLFNEGQTWRWDGSDWSPFVTATKPTGIQEHASMTYDVARNRIVLVKEATWEFDGVDWAHVPTANSPGPRSNDRVAHDTARGETLLYGGVGPWLMGDTWRYDGTDWSLAAAPATPGVRKEHAMAFDAARGETILFGGDGPSAGDDTWRWDGSAWLNGSTTPSPQTRNRHAMAFDSDRGRTVLFGGYAAAVLDDTWEWDGSSWLQSIPNTVPPARRRHAMAFDSARMRVVMHGGSSGFGLFGDTWEWDGLDWVMAHPGGAPHLARKSHAMAFDDQRQCMVVFGGSGNSGSFTDTLEWDGVSWVQLTPSSTPPPRGGCSMAFDSDRERVVLFGGSDGTTAFADLWEWDGIGWRRLWANDPPATRWGAAMCYDTIRKRGVMFGGEDGRRLGDTWETWLPNTAGQTGTGIATPRSGAGNLNDALTATPPRTGYPFTIRVTMAGTGLDAALVRGFALPGNQPFLGYTILVDLTSPEILSLPLQVNPTVCEWTLPVPSSPTLLGLPMSIQAALPGPPLALTNAVDVVVGY